MPEINLYTTVLEMKINLILLCENVSKLSYENLITQINAIEGNYFK